MRQLVYNTRNQIPLYLLWIKHTLKCCIVSLFCFLDCSTQTRKAGGYKNTQARKHASVEAHQARAHQKLASTQARQGRDLADSFRTISKVHERTFVRKWLMAKILYFLSAIDVGKGYNYVFPLENSYESMEGNYQQFQQSRLSWKRARICKWEVMWILATELDIMHLKEMQLK